MIRILDYIFYRTYLAYKKANDPAMFSSILYLFSILMFAFLPAIGFFCEIMRNGSYDFYKFIFISISILILIAVSVRYTKKGMIRELRDEFADSKWNNVIPIWSFWVMFFIFMIAGVAIHILIVKTIIVPYGLTGIGYNFLVSLFGN